MKEDSWIIVHKMCERFTKRLYVNVSEEEKNRQVKIRFFVIKNLELISVNDDIMKLIKKDGILCYQPIFLTARHIVVSRDINCSVVRFIDQIIKILIKNGRPVSLHYCNNSKIKWMKERYTLDRTIKAALLEKLKKHKLVVTILRSDKKFQWVRFTFDNNEDVEYNREISAILDIPLDINGDVQILGSGEIAIKAMKKRLAFLLFKSNVRI